MITILTQPISQLIICHPYCDVIPSNDTLELTDLSQDIVRI